MFVMQQTVSFVWIMVYGLIFLLDDNFMVKLFVSVLYKIHVHNLV